MALMPGEAVRERLTLRELLVLKVVQLVGRVGDNRVTARLPVGGADDVVCVGVLEGLDQTKRLVNGTAHGQVVHRDLAENTIRVNDEQATQGVPNVLEEHAVVLGDFVRQVGGQRDVNVAQAALCARRLGPCQQRVDRVDRKRNDLRVNGLELVKAVVKRVELGGANKGPGKREEDEHRVLSAVVREGDLGDVAIDDGVGGKGRRGRLNLRADV